MIARWLKERRERIARDRWHRGYDWAAGALLRGTPVHEIDLHLDNPFDSDEFEQGGMQAMSDYLERMKK